MRKNNHPANLAVFASRSMLNHLGVNVLLNATTKDDCQMIAACHFRRHGWESLDPDNPLNEIVELLKQSGCNLFVETLDERADSIEEAAKMREWLKLAGETGC